jgi:hypothetical protein
MSWEKRRKSGTDYRQWKRDTRARPKLASEKQCPLPRPRVIEMEQGGRVNAFHVSLYSAHYGDLM